MNYEVQAIISRIPIFRYHHTYSWENLEAKLGKYSDKKNEARYVEYLQLDVNYNLGRIVANELSKREGWIKSYNEHEGLRYVAEAYLFNRAELVRLLEEAYSRGVHRQPQMQLDVSNG